MSQKRRFTTRFAGDTETQRRELKCGVYFARMSTCGQNKRRPFLEEEIKKEERSHAQNRSSFSASFFKECGENIGHGISADKILAALYSSSLCLRASSEAGGKSSLKIGFN